MEIKVDVGGRFGVVTIPVVRKEMKHIRLRVCPDGSLAISAPYTAKEERIVAFAQREKDWIARALEKHGGVTRDDKMRLFSGDKIRYFGKEYNLVFLNGKPNVIVLGDHFIVYAQGNHEEELEKYWKKTARKIFQEDLDRLYEKYFRPLGVPKPTLFVHRTTSRWGSCNYVKGRINMNDRLLKGERKLSEGVMLHELTHLLYHDHGARFYAFIDERIPDRREREKALILLGRQ